MEKKVILIAGATGVVGAAAVEHFAGLPDWEVVAVSRRALEAPAGVRHLRVDLADADACKTAMSALRGVTHVLYAALYEKSDLIGGWRDREQMDVNLAMLRNLLDSLEGQPLRHLTLLQGAKAYGVHLAQAPVPAKERAPRHPHENFYWLQEDLVRARQAGADWTYTILRPQIVLGHAQGNPMNVVAALGAYAAVMRELGEPLSFPGGGRHVNGASDSRLIARAVEFAGTSSAARGETFNVVNGDVLCWHDVWASIARHFEMPFGEPRPLRLAEEMPKHEAVWSRIVEKSGLLPGTLGQLVNSSWQYADRVFAYGIATPNDTVMSPIKLRQHGFHACQDTEDSLLYWLGRMQELKLLPR
jgi:nucleoside-diphosphate-sugar epimerase